MVVVLARGGNPFHFISKWKSFSYPCNLFLVRGCHKTPKELTTKQRAKQIAAEIQRLNRAPQKSAKAPKNSDEVLKVWAREFARTIGLSFRIMILLVIAINLFAIMRYPGYRDYFVEHNPYMGKIVHYLPVSSRPVEHSDEEQVAPEVNKDLMERIRENKKDSLSKA